MLRWRHGFKGVTVAAGDYSGNQEMAKELSRVRSPT